MHRAPQRGVMACSSSVFLVRDGKEHKLYDVMGRWSSRFDWDYTHFGLLSGRYSSYRSRRLPANIFSSRLIVPKQSQDIAGDATCNILTNAQTRKLDDNGTDERNGSGYLPLPITSIEPWLPYSRLSADSAWPFGSCINSRLELLLCRASCGESCR